MREITPEQLTIHYRGLNKCLTIDTYPKARANLNLYREHWNCPIFDKFDGIVLSELAELGKWCNKSIYLKIDTLPIRSTDVLIRIATGMLNKITYLTDDQRQLIHYNLIRSTRWLQTEIILANLRNSPEELPF